MPENKAIPLRIFLSYGHDANEKIVRRIKADLEERGHDVWFDKHEIEVGDEWRRKITEGIVKSNRVLSFLSKYSTRDPGVCIDEVGIALGVKGGNIQTILIEGETEVKPPPSISHIQWLDMHDWKERYDPGKDEWEKWYDDKLAEIVHVVESAESLRFAGEIEALAQMLKPVKTDTRMAELIGKPFVGREWLLDAVEEWCGKRDSGSRIFWIMGDPGVGKSAFVAHLTHYGRDKVVAVHFCEWNKPGHKDARQVVLNLAFQLAARLPDYRKLLLTLPDIDNLAGKKEVAEVFDYLLVGPLQHVIDGGHSRYLIVIDALDEATEGDRNPLVEMLAYHAPRLPEWLGILVSSRPEHEVKTPLQGLAGLQPFILETGRKENQEDIRCYLRKELATELNGRDERTVIENILKKSEGIFLYVEYVCAEIRNNRLSLDRLDEFPRGLGGIYAQFFLRQFPTIHVYKDTIRQVLGVIAAAREPLELTYITHLFDWDTYDQEDFLSAVGTLFRESAGRIEPFHKSLLDWVTDKNRAGHYFVSSEEGHRLLADAGRKEYRQGVSLMSLYMKRNMPWHLTNSGDHLGLLTLISEAELGYFHQWAEKGLAAEGVVCLEFLCQQLSSSSSHAELLPIFATQLARLYNRLSNQDATERWLKLALEKSEGTGGLEQVVAVALHELGSLELSRNNYKEARTAFRRALRIARKASPPIGHEISANLVSLAVLQYLMTLDTARTIRLGKLGLEYAEKTQEPTHIAEACRIIADALKDDMQYDVAEQYLSRGVQIANEHNLTHAQLSLLTTKAWMIYQRMMFGDFTPKTTEEAFRDLQCKAESVPDWRFQGDAWSGIGQIAIFSNQLPLLHESIDRLSYLLRGRKRPYLKARLNLLEAANLHRAHRFNEAARVYEQVAEFSLKEELWSRHVDALIGQGSSLFHNGHHARAERCWEAAQKSAESCPRVRKAITVHNIERCRSDVLCCPV